MAPFPGHAIYVYHRRILEEMLRSGTMPPHLNLEPRVRVMIAGSPKHRGLGEWKQCALQHDVAAAFARMLPREPSGEYRIISIAYYADHTLDGIPARWQLSE